ncbi:MAG: hypothetical protein H6506_02190 [Calditrichaeota bacterium]|nr:hypothetical protein [Calditrichota bacterium]MCB9367073.1 hypothetical protein [Calditrichota bacterium]MCB9391443.1 hypothetical protein [Calditrichota bacterium]
MRFKTQRPGTLLLAILLSTMLLNIGEGQAASLSGRFGLWSYVRDDTVDHVQIVPLLSLNVHRFGGGAWSFESTFRGYADFMNGDDNGTSSLRVHRALLIWKPDNSRWQVRAGQQWLNEGVGRGNLAGLWASFKPCPAGELHVYGGSRTPASFKLDESTPDEGIAAGVNLQRRFGSRRINLSYYYVGKDGDVLYNGAGLDYSCTAITDVTMRARLHMNLEQSSVETGQLSVFWQTNDKVLVSVDARTQTPRVFEDSYFVKFLEDASNSAVRGGANWMFCEDRYATCMAYTVFTEEDLLYKVRAGLGDKYGELGYTHWLSAGEGDMDGFYGFGKYGFCTFEANAGFDYSRGSNSEIRPNTESQVIYGGLDWSPERAVSLGARIEHLKDQFHSEDWRALFSLSTSFRRALGGAE